MASGLALAAAATLSTAALAACSSSPAGTAGTTSASLSNVSSNAVWSQLTLSDARAAFDSYVAITNQAAQAGNRKLAESVLNGAAKDTTSTALTIARKSHLQPPYTSYAYGAPTFYLPEPPSAGDPQYFVVSVERTPFAGTTPMTPSTQDVAAGVQLPAAGRVLLLFEKSAAGGQWQLASASQLSPGESVPALATDSHGYVISESFNKPSSSLLVTPALAPPLQASVVDDGPASQAAQVVASGPLTTGLYQENKTSARGITAPSGDVYQWLLEGSNYGRLALKTTDGSVLVFYTMYMDTTVETKSALNQDIPIQPGPPISVPGFVQPLLAAKFLAPQKRLMVQDVVTFAAIDPSSADKSAKIQVLAIGGGVYSATAS
ncbi:MAG TPA: hypothetical protein VMU95_21615 [Trebonia sp.]|nr:hypothetical protein [Trebonia sp.]